MSKPPSATPQSTEVRIVSAPIYNCSELSTISMRIKYRTSFPLKKMKQEINTRKFPFHAMRTLKERRIRCLFSSVRIRNVSIMSFVSSPIFVRFRMMDAKLIISSSNHREDRNMYHPANQTRTMDTTKTTIHHIETNENWMALRMEKYIILNILIKMKLVNNNNFQF